LTRWGRGGTAKEAKDYGIVDEVLVDPTFPELAED